MSWEVCLTDEVNGWLDALGGTDRNSLRGLTQRQVAQQTGIAVGRVSQIENGELAGIDVVDRYVVALGGLLEIVANFGDEQFKVG
jgi:hypothetical protein